MKRKKRLEVRATYEEADGRPVGAGAEAIWDVVETPPDLKVFSTLPGGFRDPEHGDRYLLHNTRIYERSQQGDYVVLAVASDEQRDVHAMVMAVGETPAAAMYRLIEERFREFIKTVETAAATVPLSDDEERQVRRLIEDDERDGQG